MLLAVLGAIAFSGKAIIVKLAYRHGVDPITLLALRMLIALPFFVLQALGLIGDVFKFFPLNSQKVEKLKARA